jgi:hypothetical protein
MPGSKNLNNFLSIADLIPTPWFHAPTVKFADILSDHTNPK